MRLRGGGERHEEGDNAFMIYYTINSEQQSVFRLMDRSLCVPSNPLTSVKGSNQLHKSTFNTLIAINCCSHSGNTFLEYAVSYTHLDVYKRQAVDFLGPFPRAIHGGTKHILVCIDVFTKAVRLYACLLYTSRCV